MKQSETAPVLIYNVVKFQTIRGNLQHCSEKRALSLPEMNAML